MVLVCHVISQDHVIEELRNFMDSSRSRLATILASLVALGTLIVEI